ncbi:MAG: hypothetical protein OXJ55_19840 [Caldilineaceae bacterium]|nr:hypothetical protein [Caldilineaceae bacterium]MDE0463853.1 hypothetical protein [Caldilineaceae bacterium]
MYQLGLSGIDDGLGRLTVRRSKTDATPRTVYLTPVAMAHLDAAGSDLVFGLSVASIARRVKAAARVAGLGAGYTCAENAERAAKWLG